MALKVLKGYGYPAVSLKPSKIETRWYMVNADSLPPPALRVTPQDVLVRAADLFGEYGWNRGQDWTTDEDGMILSFCLRGAIRYAVRDLIGCRVTDAPEHPLTLNAMGLVRDAIGFEPVSYNDRHAKGKHEVVRVLRAVAAGEPVPKVEPTLGPESVIISFPAQKWIVEDNTVIGLPKEAVVA